MPRYLWFYMARENRRRDALAGEVGKEVGAAKDVAPLGDRDPNYRFQL
jgi:hypothetical protein